MEVRATVLIVVGMLAAAPLLAQEPVATPTAVPPAVSGAPSTVVPTRNVRLLDQLPTSAEILAHQWNAGVPQDVITAEQSAEHYGRLLEVGAPHPVSLQECIALALQNNTDLEIQRLGPISAAAQVRSARAIFDPVLFGDILRDRATTPATTFLSAGGASALFNQHFDFDAGLRKTLLSGGQLALSWQNQRLLTNPSVIATLVPQYTTTLGLSLNQPLLRDFGWRHALLLVEVAQNTEEQVYHQYEAGIANIITQVERAYWALVLAIENVRVQEHGVTLGKEVQRQNEGKFNVGALPQTAVLEAKSDVARREAILIHAQNRRDNARDTLRAIINFREPESAALLLIDPQDKPTVAPYDINLDRSLRTALERRPELMAARRDVYGRGLLRKNAENQLLPKLNLTGGIGLNGLSGTDAKATFPQTVVINGVPTPGQPAPTPIVLSLQQPVPANPALIGNYGHALALLPDGRYYNYSVGVTIEIPIDNAAAKAGYAQANINLEQSRLSLRKLEEGVTLEIKTAVSDLQSDLKSIDATRIARELAEENVRNQKARYDVGLATTKDLLDFQDRLTLAQAAEVQALTAYNTDLAEMRRVEGTLMSARNVMIERVSPEHAPWWASF